jgi:hypothetical protein
MTTDTHTDARPDYKIAADELQQAFDALGIKATIRGGHLDVDKTGWRHLAYNVLLENETGAASFDWKQGTGLVRPVHPLQINPRYGKDHSVNMRPIKPNPAEVLGRICSEYLEASETPFKDWAWSLGYDTDSVRARGIYDQCLAHDENLSRLGISAEVRTKLAELSNRL